MFVVLAEASCSLVRPSANRHASSIFDDWAPRQSSSGIDRDFAAWTSPSGRFVLACLKSGEDSDLYIFVGRSAPERHDTILGYGIDSIDVKWLQTQAGEVAVANRRIDTGANEILVLRPCPSKDKTFWALLYSTPGLSQTADKLTVSHCYWSLMKYDAGLGSIQLKGSWEFSDAAVSEGKQTVTEGLYEIPIFYGFKKEKGVTH